MQNTHRRPLPQVFHGALHQTPDFGRGSDEHEARDDLQELQYVVPQTTAGNGREDGDVVHAVGASERYRTREKDRQRERERETEREKEKGR